MRIRLRYVLPVTQMLIAVGLYRWSDACLTARMAAAHTKSLISVMGPTPGFTLLVLLNAPIAYLHSFYTRHLHWYWDRALFVLAMGLFWYWIALNVEQFPLKRTVTTFTLRPLRVLSDVLVMALGVLVGLSAVSRAWWWIPRLDVPDPRWLWMPGYYVFLLGWSSVLLFFFGRDLVLVASALRPRQKPVGSPN